MIQEILQIQELDILLIDPFVLDHLHSHVDRVKLLVLDIVVVIENSIRFELYHVQDTLSFITNEETLDLLTNLLSESFTIVFFVDLTLEIDSSLEVISLHINLHQNHVLDLRLHLKVLSKIYNQTPMKIKTTKLKTFESLKETLDHYVYH